MLKNYIKVSFRSLLRNKVATVVNVIGLSISMVIGVLLFGMVKSNWETDHFHPFLERTFRVLTKIQNGDNTSLWATSPEPVAAALEKLSFVMKVVKVRHGGEINVLTKMGEIPVKVIFSEPSFFEVFGFETESDDKNRILTDPNSILLGEEIAKKLFANSNPIGQSVKFDGWGTYLVAGIVKKQSKNTHIPIEVMLSISAASALEKRSLIPAYAQSWTDYKSTSIYALTRSNTDIITLNNELLKLSDQVNKNQTEKTIFSAQDLESITPWNPKIQNDFYAGMNWQGIMLWIFLALALTLLAAFNYTALSIARILTRAKEVGIRKANGAVKKQIFIQFIIEAVMLALFSLCIAYVIVLIIYLSGGLSIDKDLNISPDIYFIPILLCYTLLTGFVAGAVPALILSKFKPIDVLKNLKNLRFLLKINFYKAIVIVQFAVTIMLMIFFVILKDSGSNTIKEMLTKIPEDVVIVNLKDKDAKSLSSEIEKLSQVKKISLTNYLPVNNPSEKCTIRIANVEKVVSFGFIDYNFVSVFNLKLIAGSNLTRDQFVGSEQFVLLNESATRLLRQKDSDPGKFIGQILKVDSLNLQIIGVVADQSLHAQTVIPSIYRFSNSAPRFLSVKTLPGATIQVSEYSKKVWEQNFPNYLPDIFSYKEKIMDDAQKGSAQLNLSFGLLCSVVMLVACLGIMGMANYAVQANLMQIGIRKTFGANDRQIIYSVTFPFLKLLLIAGILGAPLGWLCGSLLKTRFGANVDLGFVNILSGISIVVAVALIIVISQTFRSIYIDPKKVLQGD